jgi:hypothetical protein
VPFDISRPRLDTPTLPRERHPWANNHSVIPTRPTSRNDITDPTPQSLLRESARRSHLPRYRIPDILNFDIAAVNLAKGLWTTPPTSLRPLWTISLLSLPPPPTDVKRRLRRTGDHRAFRSTCWKLSESALGVSRQEYLEDISATAFLGALVFALPCPTAAAGLSLGRSVLDIVTGTTKVGLAAVDCDVR